MTQRTFTKLGSALDSDNYEWLLNENPKIVEAIETEVLAGAEPDDIRRFMVAHVGEHRTPFIARCVSAARWLKSSQAH